MTASTLRQDTAVDKNLYYYHGGIQNGKTEAKWDEAYRKQKAQSSRGCVHYWLTLEKALLKIQLSWKHMQKP